MEHRDDDIPTGIRDDEAEETPLGPAEVDPDDDAAPGSGPGAMPGIPTDGEPPTSA